MLIIGLTGSIGMGKSTVASMFADRGFAVSDSDAIVHDLYEGEAVEPVGRLVPEAVVNGVIDRRVLSEHLNSSPHLFPRLERIVHPLVRERQKSAIATAKASSAPRILLDIPLLFETRADARVDAVVVVHCRAETQRARVLSRPDMTPEKFEAISAKQMTSEQKKQFADFLIDTDQPLEATEQAVDDLARALAHRNGSAYRSHWAEAVRNKTAYRLDVIGD
ncbi:MAG: dephospho-CoA kinase [Pseudomonadota bacterium]